MAAESKARRESAPIRVPLSALAPDPANARKMSDAARAGLGVSMEEFGELGMVFNDRTGQWVSGHQRYERLLAAGAAECMRTGTEGYIEHPKTGERFHVRFVDWDETKQRMANLVANNPHIGGEFTEDALAQLKELEGEDGFELLALDELELELARSIQQVGEQPGVTDPNAEWQGMPEFNQEDKTAFRSLAVHFKTQQDVDDFARVVGQPITAKTRFLWYPKIEIETYADKEYGATKEVDK